VVGSGGSTPTYCSEDPCQCPAPADRGRELHTAAADRARELQPSDPNRDTSFIFANVGVILLFISIFTFGTWVLTGVVEEKQSRVVEVVLATMDPRDLLMGKVLGIGLLGLVQLTLMIGVGIGLGIALDRFPLPASTPGAVAMLLLWFALGYAFYATARGPRRSRVADGVGVERRSPVSIAPSPTCPRSSSRSTTRLGSGPGGELPAACRAVACAAPRGARRHRAVGIVSSATLMVV
jgi:hypothetical protein